jgi:predicted small secreted protein
MGKPILIILSILAVMALSALFAGCATMNDVMIGKDKGIARIYPVNADQAWEIAKDVFLWEGIDDLNEHRDKGYMLTGSVMNMASSRPVIEAWIEPVDENNTTVTIFINRGIDTNVATELTEAIFHKRFADAVEVITKRRLLHSKPPE